MGTVEKEVDQDNREIAPLHGKETNPHLGGSAPLYVHPATLYCALKGCQEVTVETTSKAALKKAAAFSAPKGAKKRGFCNPNDASFGAAKAIGCVACAYKILVPDVTYDREFTKLVPNVRPELCPRANPSSREATESRAYNVSALNVLVASEEKGGAGCGSILCVGDGDLSFGTCVKKLLEEKKVLLKEKQEEEDIGERKSKKSKREKKLEEKINSADTGSVLSTSYETKETLNEVYGEETIQKCLNVLGKDGIEFEVDCTKLEKGPIKDHSKFDSVVWNFPCTAEKNGMDGQNPQREANYELLTKFFGNVESVINPDATIVLTHKTKPPFNQWKIVTLVEGTAGGDKFECKARVVFDRSNYIGYTNRKALDKKSFPCHDSEQYIFGLKEKKEVSEEEEEAEEDIKEDWGESRGLIRVTEDLLNTVRSVFV